MMPKLPGINHLRAIKAFEKAGFQVIRQGKHISMSDGDRIIVIPRSNPINAYTMAGIISDAGLSIDEFKQLLWLIITSIIFRNKLSEKVSSDR